MSLHEHSSASCLPITAIAWTSNSGTCPKDFSIISTTQDGGAANFVRGFGVKSGYFLCYSKNAAGGNIVADIQVISEKETIPHGYCYIPEYMEPKTSVWKKKRVCVRLVPLGSVEMAIVDIRVTAKSRLMLQHYTCLGDIHGYVIWCKKGHVSSPVPEAKPRRVTLDIRTLSLDQPAPPLPLRPSNGPPAFPTTKTSRRRSNLEKNDVLDSVYDNSNTFSISAMDGVPFALHPKFEAQPSETVSGNTMKDIRIKSVQEIENEYNYTFAVEESAANRAQP
uniref:Multivesicular body subunit 12A n=1 Tax=Paramormyrops kingsleyae TaxID=1676925 RepID=A0A3B3SCS6_9TELE|nr:multivesicular body subunit 12A [Paramormyrops kingsleyae]